MAKQSGSFELALVGQAVPSNAGLGQILNPEGVPVIVTRCVLYVDTPSAGAANINVGIGAKDSDLSTQISALAINGAITGKAYQGLNPAAKAEHDVWGATGYLSATGSAACTAFRGRLLVEYVRVDSE
jgi:hypothetical protein